MFESTSKICVVLRLMLPDCNDTCTSACFCILCWIWYLGPVFPPVLARLTGVKLKCFSSSYDTFISCGIFFFLIHYWATIPQQVTVTKLWTWFWHMLSEDLKRTKMSCMTEMQLFDEKKSRQDEKQEKKKILSWAWKKKFLYYWKQKLFLQPFEDDGKTEEDGAVRDVFCKMTPDFLR